MDQSTTAFTIILYMYMYASNFDDTNGRLVPTHVQYNYVHWAWVKMVQVG